MEPAKRFWKNPLPDSAGPARPDWADTQSIGSSRQGLLKTSKIGRFSTTGHATYYKKFLEFSKAVFLKSLSGQCS